VRSCWAGVLAVLVPLLAACGGSNPPASAEPATVAPSTTTAQSASGAPAELQGTWRLVSDTVPEPTRLYLRETSYIVSRGGGSHHGTYSVDGDTIEFTSTCSDTNQEGVGHYRWTLEGDTLHLELIGKDECSGRSAVLEDATYERSG
jgi:hypothetical protein